MKNSLLAESIINNIGGSENVIECEHCSTRLRFTLADKTKVKVNELKNIDGVLGVVDQINGVQIIIGNEVANVFDAITSKYSFQTKEIKEDSNNIKVNPVQKFMNNLADCFVPLIPVLIAAGLMSAITTLIQTFGWMDTTSSTFQILDFMGDAPIYFIPFMLAYSASKKFKVNTVITMGVMATLLYPSLAGLSEGVYTYLFGLPVRLATYTSSVVPALLIVWAQIYIEKFVKKVTPKAVAAFLESLLEYFILTVLALVILGPIASYLSDLLAAVINLIVGKNAWLTCAILGAVMIPIISTGLHYSLMPIVITNFMMNGYDTFWAGPSFCSNLALAGAVLALAIASKDQNMKQTASTTGLSAALGITEPAIYGVAFVKQKVMVATCIGGGVGGLISGILGVNAYGMAPAGLTSIAVLAGPTFVNAIIAIVVAFVLGFVLSFMFEKKSQLEGK